MRIFCACAHAKRIGSNAPAVSNPARVRNCLRFKFHSDFIISSTSNHVSAVSHATSGAQFEALDLSGGGLRQLCYELNPARVFVRREPVFYVPLQRAREI